jgi:hypothetical protein
MPHISVTIPQPERESLSCRPRGSTQSLLGFLEMPLIAETSTSGFISAMNAAFDAAYAAASDPRVASCPPVVQAVAAAKVAQSNALAATEAAQAATGLFRSIKATMAASKAANQASVAEVNLRAAIEEALALAA